MGAERERRRGRGRAQTPSTFGFPNLCSSLQITLISAVDPWIDRKYRGARGTRETNGMFDRSCPKGRNSISLWAGVWEYTSIPIGFFRVSLFWFSLRWSIVFRGKAAPCAYNPLPLSLPLLSCQRRLFLPFRAWRVPFSLLFFFSPAGNATKALVRAVKRIPYPLKEPTSFPYSIFAQKRFMFRHSRKLLSLLQLNWWKTISVRGGFGDPQDTWSLREFKEFGSNAKWKNLYTSYLAITNVANFLLRTR